MLGYFSQRSSCRLKILLPTVAMYHWNTRQVFFKTTWKLESSDSIKSQDPGQERNARNLPSSRPPSQRWHAAISQDAYWQERRGNPPDQLSYFARKPAGGWSYPIGPQIPESQQPGLSIGCRNHIIPALIPTLKAEAQLNEELNSTYYPSHRQAGSIS